MHHNVRTGQSQEAELTSYTFLNFPSHSFIISASLSQEGRYRIQRQFFTLFVSLTLLETPVVILLHVLCGDQAHQKVEVIII